jgi:predicted phosphodiesterase
MRFAILGDRTGGHQPGVHGAIVQEIQRLKPDFVITVGDMIEGYVNDEAQIRREWDEYKELVEPLTMPLYYVSGNHDIWEEGFAQLYKELSGADPYYSFDVRGVHFIVLSTGPYDYVDDVPDEQIQWLMNDLSGSQDALYTLVFFHKPYWIDTIAAGEEDRFHNIFVEHGVDAVFTGHYHVYFSGTYDGIAYTTVGSSGGGCSPGPTGLMYHFAWVTVDGEGVSIAPVKMGSVLPWDEFTASEFRLVDRIESQAAKVEKFGFQGIPTPARELTVTLQNLNETESLQDTLLWHLPENWAVSPAVQALSLDPGDSIVLSFRAACNGFPYPTPSFTLDYPYGQGKDFEFGESMGITRTAHAVFAGDRRPVIDGKLTEDVWTDGVIHSELFAPDGSPVTIEKTEFMFAWDEDNLYLAARCEETRMDSIAALVTEHDGAVYGEDCVGYFLQPDVQDGPAYQIYFNPLGSPFDQKITIENGVAVDVQRDWNGDYEVAASRSGNSWSIEIRIPFDELDAESGEGDSWGLNFRRKQRRLSSSADWIVAISYDPRDFGKLEMK